MDMFDIRYWRCVIKKAAQCPNSDIKFFLYTPDTGTRRKRIDIKNPNALKYMGWNPHKESVIIIHGFNGTENKTPMTIIRNAYLSTGEYNVFTVDWESLTIFPCYLSALSNTRLVSRCSAQLYSYLTHHGALAKKIHCVGHSLGAHICGMMSRHLNAKQYKIIGLDPARPLVDSYGDAQFRLTRDDAYHVQVIHTNAGFLGEENVVGHVDFCVNGGTNQPGCKGHALRQARCSHFQSACYYAASILKNVKLIGVPCSNACPKRQGLGLLPGKVVPMGIKTPISAKGQYCVSIRHNKDCPFD
ncbi:lipase member H-A [Chrysoperla carnea]|uniref:lipase member H-A n=1 Tax=Chrysoperla carnea TaxID=189513 RepID=UPI001D09730C|nr:lipase member H-A [Chrysoperla carnea]